MVLPAVRLAGFSIAEFGGNSENLGFFRLVNAQWGQCVGVVLCAAGQPARGQQYPQIAKNTEWKRGCNFPPQLQWVS